MSSVGQCLILESCKKPRSGSFSHETWPTLQQDPDWWGSSMVVLLAQGPVAQAKNLSLVWPILPVEGGESCLSGCRVGAMGETLALWCVDHQAHRL